SVTDDGPEVDPLQVQRARVGLDQVADVGRAITAFHADVVVEVHRAVDVQVDVVRVVALVDARRQLEGGELAGDRDVRHDVVAPDAANRRDRTARVRE